MKTSVFYFSFALFIVSCSQSVMPTNTGTTKTDINEKTEPVMTEELAQGKSLYEQNCVRCHKLYAPASFTETAWKAIVPGMARKARVDSETENKILNYVLTFSKK